MVYYLILYSPGPEWVAGKPFFEQKLMEHGSYMKQLYDAGTLLEGGPFTDHSGGLSIIRVEDEAAAKAVLAEDPALINGVFVAELRPWFRVDWPGY